MSIPSLFVMLALFAQGASAISFFTRPDNKQPGPAPKDCSDFSGTWEGSCKDDQEEFKIMLTIHQGGCSFIEMGGLPLPIGGMNTLTSSYPEGDIKKPGATTTDVSTVNWDKDKKVLTLKSFLFAKALGETKKPMDIGISVLEQSLELDGKKLKLTTTENKIKTTCTLEKPKD